jgi:hypothetical protein
MPYTRTLARYCQSFTEQPECPSDVFIGPLVHTSDLMCRITEYFSYDEIAFSEINGDSVLELSTSNFRRELQRLQDSMPDLLKQHGTFISMQILDLTNRNSLNTFDVRSRQNMDT